MTRRAGAKIAAFLLMMVGGTGAASADVDVTAASICFDEALSNGTPPTECVDAAHATCLGVPDDTAAVASLCFVEARADWSEGIKAGLSELNAIQPTDLRTVIGIEVKYDLLSALLQCDRMEELSLAVGTQEVEAIQRQDLRCMATASGLAYLRLQARVAALK